ncbi:hypothetical protein K493DRAFT_316723 [Basidiobolus meristosporus CBS 931.73]|uniref:Uncharacterized protein n=1 Tax=Basidiobolus meristosporus CBS 931.73 TaxID=1314790 RepID=A0A1Y1Y3Q4_9FUNG|nr:hypothetical protein K493DRAFT_316723 [Basidiobolus meristosporus CBS 931.73]|eukprot:ORX92224.1 hypothetical protein K493DRAFT_316723 [Basidiobolus meristosporus CBS 931.73]
MSALRIGVGRIATVRALQLAKSHVAPRIYHVSLRATGVRSLDLPGVREFHASIPRSSANFGNLDPEHPTVKKILSNPEVLEALQSLVTLLSTKGVNVASGSPPNFMQIMRVMSDPQVRTQAQQLTKLLQDSGIKLDMTEVMGMMKKPSAEAPVSKGRVREEECIVEEKPQIEQKTESSDGMMSKLKSLFGRRSA